MTSWAIVIKIEPDLAKETPFSYRHTWLNNFTAKRVLPKQLPHVIYTHLILLLFQRHLLLEELCSNLKMTFSAFQRCPKRLHRSNRTGYMVKDRGISPHGRSWAPLAVKLVRWEPQSPKFSQFHPGEVIKIEPDLTEETPFSYRHTWLNSFTAKRVLPKQFCHITRTHLILSLLPRQVLLEEL